MALEQELSELELMLKRHDRYYEYSDDYSVYRRGRDDWGRIQNLSTKLKLAGCTKEVQELFKKYYDDEYFFGCSRYRCEIND